MLPDQPIAGCLHRADIERVTQAPRVLALVGASRERLANRVGVMPGAGRVARIERVIDKLGVPDGDITRESRVQRPGQLLDREVALELEIDDLAERVHTGVSPARRRKQR